VSSSIGPTLLAGGESVADSTAAFGLTASQPQVGGGLSQPQVGGGGQQLRRLRRFPNSRQAAAVSIETRQISAPTST